VAELRRRPGSFMVVVPAPVAGGRPSTVRVEGHALPSKHDERDFSTRSK
jgi:hypothetical protein